MTGLAARVAAAAYDMRAAAWAASRLPSVDLDDALNVAHQRMQEVLRELETIDTAQEGPTSG